LRQKTKVDVDFHNLASDKGLLYKINGTAEIVDGPIHHTTICKMLECAYYHGIACTAGFELCRVSGSFILKDKNEQATKDLSERFVGEDLHGNILALVAAKATMLRR